MGGIVRHGWAKLAPLGAALVLACGSSGPNAGAPADASTASDAFEGDGAEPPTDAPTFTCSPADVSQFTAPAYKPANAQPGACSLAQVDGFFATCLSSDATDQTCSGFVNNAQNTTCFACLFSGESDPKWGPVVSNGRFVSLNADGCMELTDVSGGKACASADQAAAACEDVACNANCPINRQDPPATRVAELKAYDACTALADQSGCKPFVSAAACVASESDGGAAAACFHGSTFQELYSAIAPVFCVASSG